MSSESNTPVDPRIQIELETLNTATDNINKFEVELDEAKCEFKRILSESAVRIKQSAHKLGNSIEVAKPYYESRIYAGQLTKETQQAAYIYEKAKSVHTAAREMADLAEQGLSEKSLDTACQEMLSHAASKVNQSQLEITGAHNSLKMCQLKLEVANNRVGKLQSQLKQAIKASSYYIKRNFLLLNLLPYQHDLSSLPYYETRANYNGLLKTQKQRINELEGKVSEAKITYNEALKNLEQISEEIHHQRQHQKNVLNSETILKQSESSVSRTGPVGTTENLKLFPSNIDLHDDYLEISMSDRQMLSDAHDCPNLVKNFETILTFPQKLYSGMHKSASTNAATSNDNILFTLAELRTPYVMNSSSGAIVISGCERASGSTKTAVINGKSEDDEDNDIEQWTDIRLSHSESTSSSYSNQSLLNDQVLGGCGVTEDAHSHHSSSSSSDEPKRKVTCTTIFQEDQLNKKQSLSQWLARSNSFKTMGRRQSLDLLIDAGDRMKDVFSYGFQKVGKSLERRNSESELINDKINRTRTSCGSAITNDVTTTPSTGGDFFFFSRSEPKEMLTDEQVENLLLSHSIDEHGTILVEELKSPLQQLTKNTFSLSALLM